MARAGGKYHSNSFLQGGLPGGEPRDWEAKAESVPHILNTRYLRRSESERIRRRGMRGRESEVEGNRVGERLYAIYRSRGVRSVERE